VLLKNVCVIVIMRFAPSRVPLLGARQSPTFRGNLPRSGALHEDANAAILELHVKTEPNGRIILVVEDEWFIREEIAAALRDVGWQVFEAESGEAAIALAVNEASIDVLFTDIQLAGLRNGWDVADAFRVAHPQSGVVYASGNTRDRTRRVADSRIFDKPYRVADVLTACEQLAR
jgi:two-component system OmpR family response regulator